MRTHGVEIHPRSFELGMINAFAEMVAMGVKRLAISPPLLPGAYKEIQPALEALVEGSGIRSYLERSLLVTDLQSAEFTRGRWSVLLFREEETLEAYLALKSRQASLEAEGRYEGGARVEISREFMRLLSYPEEVIEAKLARNPGADPFVLLKE